MGVGLDMATTLKAIQGGAGAVTGAVEPYGLLPKFERAVIYLACTNRDVYARVGVHLDPKAIVDKIGVQLVKAAQAIAAEVGEGPSNALTVIQRLRTWREEGKVTIEQVQEANEYLDAAEDDGLPDPEEVIKEMAALLKKRAKRESVKKALDVMAKGGDFQKLGEEMAATERIGESRRTLGEGFHDGLIDQILADNATTRFPTGCLELNDVTGGGLPKGYTLFLGREKSGKSMVLSSIAADALWNGKNVAIATLELEPRKQLERIMANLTCLPLHSVQRDGAATNRRWAKIKDRLGVVKVARFAPDTPVQEITRWVEELQELVGRIDLLVVDYADLVGAGKPGKDASDYRDAKIVGNAFRDHALRHEYVTISATQGRRGSGTSKPLDIDDVADSQHKVRVADLVIAMRMDAEDKSMVDWFVMLNRDGTDRVGTGPLTTARETGRMYPVSREEPW